MRALEQGSHAVIPTAKLARAGVVDDRSEVLVDGLRSTVRVRIEQRQRVRSELGRRAPAEVVLGSGDVRSALLPGAAAVVRPRREDRVELVSYRGVDAAGARARVCRVRQM